MIIDDLTDRQAVLEAMAEHDRLGRKSFLERYGYGEAKSYYVENDGILYDSKAIIGVSIGKQFPENGALRNDEFSGGRRVKKKLESLGFKFADDANISSTDIALLRSSRAKSRYVDLTEKEHAAYIRVHLALKRYGEAVIQLLGRTQFELNLTSGFIMNSGIRGYIPRDLWFSVYAKDNKDAFVGHPQVFMIVSENGVEFGYNPSTHPSVISNSKIKARMRAASARIFEQLPRPDDELAKALASKLETQGGWHFLKKPRKDHGATDFPNLDQWLSYLKSPSGFDNAGGSLSKYVEETDLDERDLMDDCIILVRTFEPLMRSVIVPDDERSRLSSETDKGQSFATILSAALAEFQRARQGPYSRDESLWSLMDEAESSLNRLAPVSSREHLSINWSLGSGNWARIPWISLLNDNVTTSTEKGTYAVFLVSNDLKRIYLVLGLGVTDITKRFGQLEGGKAIIAKANEIRKKVSELEEYGFTLGSAIDLASEGRLPRNYQRGTVAFVEFSRDELPADEQLEEFLEPLLSACDRLAEDDVEPSSPNIPVRLPEPYSVSDALDGLFMGRDEFERIISAWRSKKNLVLQGAPGVGKSFIARRLAYALIGEKDPDRVGAIQFHQSYGYEDFVQGYRPDGSGGFARSDGVFHRFCLDAIENPDSKFVFMIDEINRGNLSKIFGELMLLIENDKRSSEWGVQLTYAYEDEPRFFIPDNIYIVGMMNTADRSLSLVDYALRRRFAFITMDPQFDSPEFRKELENKQVPPLLVGKIIERMNALNHAISEDRLNLGRGYQVGHSFFVPTDDVSDPDSWLERCIQTEIRPLLEEYWFDDPDKADGWVKKMSAP